MAYNNGIVVGAQPWASGSQVGVREELADYIAVVDQKSTPFVSMAPKGKDIGNTQFSWQADIYTAPALGGTADGTDVTSASGNTSNASANRARMYNLAQVFRRQHRTGFVAENMNVAAVSSETARGVAKRMVELKRDMEATFTCTNQAYTAEANTPTAALTASLGQWLTGTPATTGLGVPYSSTFAPASGAVDTTATASITETTVQAVLTAIYGNTGTYRDYDCIVGTTLKRAFTSLTTATAFATANVASNTLLGTSIRTFNTELSSDVYKSSIDIFEGDFGRFILHPSTFINYSAAGTYTASATRGYVIPMEMCEIRYCQLPKVQDLPDAGGGPWKLIQAIAGLVCKNASGFGMFNAGT